MHKEELSRAIEASIRDKTHATARMFARSHTSLFGEAEDFDLHASMGHIYNVMQLFPEKQPSAESLGQYRDEIISALRGLYGLTQFREMVFDWVFHHIVMCRAKSSEDSPPPAHDFFNVHFQFLLDMEEKHDEADSFPPLSWDLAEEFVSMIPLRMTNSVYRDYLRDSLRLLAMSEGIQPLRYRMREWENMYGMITNAELPECCTAFKQALDEYWQTDFPTDDIEHIRTHLENIDILDKKMQKSAADLFVLLDAVDAALIMVKFANREDMAEMQAWIGKDVEAQDDAVTEALDALDTNSAREESLHDMAMASEAEADELENWIQFNDLYYDAGLLHYGFTPITYSDPAELPALGDDETDAALLKSIEEAIGFVDACVAGQPSRRKRYLRQYCRRNIPLPYPDIMEGYENYFIDTYERLDDFNKLVMVACADFFEVMVSARYDEV
jgi:hypothetical protein